MDMISVRQAPELAPRAIAYFQQHWATAETLMMYEDAINRSLGAANPLPQWYLLMANDRILGCAGLITNDFISRGELYPWLCALYVEETQRGRGYGTKLIEHVATETRRWASRSCTCAPIWKGTTNAAASFITGSAITPGAKPRGSTRGRCDRLRRGRV